MKLIEKKKVRIGKVKKTEDGEWIVPVYVDGKFNDDMTYYTSTSRSSGKEDAEGTRDQMIKDMKNSKEYDLEEETSKEENLIVLEKEVVISQDSKKIILEKGDRVKILKEFLISIDENDIESDFLEFLNHHISGYGESGPMDARQYLSTLSYILGIISNDLKDAVKNEFGYFTDDTLYYARKMLTSSLQTFLKNY